MKTMSATSLWKQYDRKALPLDVTVLSTADEANCTIEYAFFNGEATIGGVARIYSEYYRNKKPNGASIIVMNDAEALMDRTHVDLFLSRGYHVLLLDYAGKRSGKGYFTLYPPSLSRADYFLDPTCLTQTGGKLKTTCWYVWTTVMLRGITYLESKSETDPSKINVFGEKLGAFQVWKAVFIEPQICCGIALNNSGYVSLPFDEQENFFYQTCFNNTAYVQNSDVPVLIQVCTNADDNSLDYMNALYLMETNPKSKFSISERSDNAIGYDQKDNVELFMDYYNFGKGALPACPEIKPKKEEHALYYEIKADASMEIEKIELFASQGIDNDAYKNWKSYVPVLQGDSYLVKVNVPNNKQEMSAFVNVKYKNSLSVSSEIIKNIPMLMGVRSTPITSSRLLYTVEYGLDEWTCQKKVITDEPVLKMKRGSHGISGVTSIANSLTLYKLGDPSYCGKGKSLLQLTFYSRKNQILTFTAVEREGDSFVKYYYTRQLYANHDWIRLDLSAGFFKSPAGTPEDWSNVVALTIDSEDPVIVNSMIWI